MFSKNDFIILITGLIFIAAITLLALRYQFFSLLSFFAVFANLCCIVLFLSVRNNNRFYKFILTTLIVANLGMILWFTLSDGNP